MITEIKTIEDVKQFAKDLIGEGCVFHPDDDFNDYVTIATKESCYTEEEADQLNYLMSCCFDVCKKEHEDIYKIMLIK